MRIFQVYFATTIDPESEAGAWEFVLVEEKEVIFRKKKFEIERTNIKSLELAAIHDAILNLQTVKSNFRVLLCHARGQLLEFGSNTREQREVLYSSLLHAGLEVKIKKYNIELINVKNAKILLKIQSDNKAYLKKELESF